MNETNAAALPAAISKVTQYINAAYGAPVWVVVFVAAIVFGYVLKKWPRFPNDKIPFGVVAFSAAAMLLGMWSVRPAGKPGFGFWCFTTALLGVIDGFAAWGSHRFILKRYLEPKFPWLQSAMQEAGLDTAPPFPLPTSQPPPNNPPAVTNTNKT